jgi:hypothetical protein
MSSTMRYSVSLGAPPGATHAVDYGTWEADSPEDAILQALRDADWSRQYETPRQMSASPDYGRGATGGSNGNAGNAAQDRSGWFFVATDAGQFVGVYDVREREDADA